MGKDYKRLSRQEWQELFILQENGYSNIRIAKEIDRRVSSIGRALLRSGPRNRLERRLPWFEKAKLGYERDQARKAKKRRRVRIKDAAIRIYIEEQLKAGRSPEIISGRIEQDLPGKSISTEAIYQFIYNDARQLIKYLVIAGNRGRRKRTSHRKYRHIEPSAPKRSISKRPKRVELRNTLGHWEGDTIVSRKSSDCVLTLIERKTRYRFYIKLPKCCSEEAKRAIIHTLNQLPPKAVLSLTLDNGPENAKHKELEEALGFTVYFCHPYSAFERGSVEYANRNCRTRFPKGTDFSKVSQDELDQVATFWNHRPMKCLGFRTPYEVFFGDALLEAA